MLRNNIGWALVLRDKMRRRALVLRHNVRRWALVLRDKMRRWALVLRQGEEMGFSAETR